MAEAKIQLISHTRIWDRAPHNSFADLIKYKGSWFCALREGPHHYKGAPGRIVVLRSDDGEAWAEVATLQHESYDLRDPHFSVDPSGKLVMVLGASTYNDDYDKVFLGTMISQSEDGETWSELDYVLGPNEWLWRITWHEGVAYGISYSFSVVGDLHSTWRLKLFSSQDCRDWSVVSELDVPDRPNETTLRFTDEGELVAFIRREAEDKNFWLGRCKAPYTDWEFTPGDIRVGGPNFMITDSGSMWAACRICVEGKGNTQGDTTVGRLTQSSYTPMLMLPSGGDNSYPGMCYEEDILWLSYYSSHEGKAAVYLAKLRLPEE